MSSKVHEAILAVMGQVSGVEKAGRMTSGAKYSYAQAEDVLRKIRPAMLESGLTMVPVHTEVALNEVYKTSSGSSMNRIVVKRTYRITHAPSGEFLDIEVLGEGSDVGDKACNKALTGAGKYARREAFSLEFGEDDPDKTPSIGMERESSEAPKVAKPTSAGKSKGAYEVAKGMIEKSGDFHSAINLANGVFVAHSEGRLKHDQASELCEAVIGKLMGFSKDFAHAAQVQTLVSDAVADKLITGSKYVKQAEELVASFSMGVE